MDDNTASEDAVSERRVGADLAIVAQDDAVAKDRIGADVAAATDFGAPADDGPRFDPAIGTEDRRLVDNRRRRDERRHRRRWVEGESHPGIGVIRLLRQQRGHARGRPGGQVRMDQTGARLALGEIIGVASVVEKTDVGRTRRLKGRDIGKRGIAIRLATDPRARYLR